MNTLWVRGLEGTETTSQTIESGAQQKKKLGLFRYPLPVSHWPFQASRDDLSVYHWLNPTCSSTSAVCQYSGRFKVRTKGKLLQHMTMVEARVVMAQSGRMTAFLLQLPLRFSSLTIPCNLLSYCFVFHSPSPSDVLFTQHIVFKLHP